MIGALSKTVGRVLLGCVLAGFAVGAYIGARAARALAARGDRKLGEKGRA